MPCPFSCPIAFPYRTSGKPSFASYEVKVNEMRGHQSPVTDEEELHLRTNLTNSSPSNSQPSAKTPKPSLNLAAGMLDNSRMKTRSRSWQVLVSFVGHSVALAIIIVIPLLYTHSMDLSQFRNTFLVAPPPPPPAPRMAPTHPAFHLRETKLYQPRVIPRQIAQIKDEPPPSQPAFSGMSGGVPGGVPGGQLGGVLGGILGPGNRQLATPPPPKPISHHGPYRVGGKVQAPRLIRQVQPIYPILAKEARISGEVAIDSVIDEHGNVTQAKVISGNPLLVTSALNAVEQWKYQPTLLNGQPISVDLEVTVTFKLGS
jgi:periplasmic protein TonB